MSTNIFRIRSLIKRYCDRRINKSCELLNNKINYRLDLSKSYNKDSIFGLILGFNFLSCQ